MQMPLHNLQDQSTLLERKPGCIFVRSLFDNSFEVLIFHPAALDNQSIGILSTDLINFGLISALGYTCGTPIKHPFAKFFSAFW